MIERYFLVFFIVEKKNGSINYGQSHHSDRYGNYVNYSHLRKTLMDNDHNVLNVIITNIQELNFDDYTQYIREY